MEEELFSWEEWEDIDSGVTQYHNIILKVSVGKFPVGTKFDYAMIHIPNGQINFGNQINYANRKEYILKLHFRIGEPII